MNLRSADEGDLEAIREAARRSFRESYSLSPREIDAILTVRFAPEDLRERVDGSERRLYVADGGHAPIAGFAETDAEGALRWLHVHPDDRGRGVGTELVELVREGLDDRSTPFTARVLEPSREGGRFLEQFGLYWTGITTMEVGTLRFAEQVYTSEGQERTTSEPAVDVPDEVRVDGETRRLCRDEGVSGTLAPFYPLSGDDGRGEFFCSGCGNSTVSPDVLERLECDECGNTHRADDWDGAYL